MGSGLRRWGPTPSDVPQLVTPRPARTHRPLHQKNPGDMKPSSSAVKLGLLQVRCTPDLAANSKKVLAQAERAANQGAQIICMPELFRSQYFCQSEDYENFKLAETIPGPTTAASPTPSPRPPCGARRAPGCLRASRPGARRAAGPHRRRWRRRSASATTARARAPRRHRDPRLPGHRRSNPSRRIR